KILIVDPDATRASALKVALAAAGADVTVAPSGAFALTMLEWNRHDIVVSRARIDDMDGHELCAILKSDPSTRHIRFGLVAGANEVTPVQTTVAGVDLVLGPTLAISALVPLVLRLHQGAAAPAPSPAPAAPRTMAMPATAPAAAPWAKTPPTILTPAPVARAVPAQSAAPAPPSAEMMSMPSGTFQGSLDAMDLTELTQAIAMGGKNGRLILALPQGGGVIAFEAGHVVHAEYRGMVGEQAFAALVTTA